MKTIISEGSTTFRCNCPECGAVFTYELSDVWKNYVSGGDWVGCPTCGKSVRHMGAWRDRLGDACLARRAMHERQRIS